MSWDVEVDDNCDWRVRDSAIHTNIFHLQVDDDKEAKVN